MNSTIELKRIKCFKKEGWWFDDEIRLLLSPVEFGTTRYLNGVEYHDAVILDCKSFDDGQERHYNNLKATTSSSAIHMVLYDDDTFDADDILGAKALYSSPVGTSTQIRRFNGHGTSYEVECQVYPATYSGHHAQIVFNKVKTAMIKKEAPPIITKAMEQKAYSKLSETSLSGVSRQIDAVVSYELNKAASHAQDAMQPSMTEKEMKALLDAKLEPVKERFASNYLEQLGYVEGQLQRSIVSSYINELMSLKKSKHGATLYKLTSSAPGNPVLDKLPLSPEGRAKIASVAYSRLQLAMRTKTNELTNELNIQNREKQKVDLKAFEQRVEQQIETFLSAAAAEIESKVMEIAKLVMFQYPEICLPESVRKQMVETVKEVQKGNAYVPDSPLDNYDDSNGYGVRPSLSRRLGQFAIESVNDFSAAHIPSKKGKIRGLGSDMFFDIAMTANQRIRSAKQS